jgi:hypothetical protein
MPDIPLDSHRHHPQGNRLMQRARIPLHPRIRCQITPLPRLRRQRRQLRQGVRLGGQGQQDILPATGGRLHEQGHPGHERSGHSEHTRVREGVGDDRLRAWNARKRRSWRNMDGKGLYDTACLPSGSTMLPTSIAGQAAKLATFTIKRSNKT